MTGGQNSSEGFLEFFNAGKWGTICSEGFDIYDAHVVCSELGYPGAEEVVDASVFGSGRAEIWLQGLHCDGTESSLAQCSYDGAYGNNNCSHEQDVALRCSEYGL